jgi:uncharacterized protein YjbJ (UPF0337 family)
MARSPSCPPTVGTIGGTLRAGFDMTIWCGNRGCRHRADVDLAAIADRYGDDLPVFIFVARSACFWCHGRWPAISIQISPANTPQVVARTSIPTPPIPRARRFRNKKLRKLFSMCHSYRSWNINKEHVKGAVDHAKGAVKEGVGKATGNERLRVEGKLDKAKGDIHKVAGDVKGADKKATR